MPQRLALLIACAVVVVLALPASALAEIRYAAPSGTGIACTEASPCSLATALTDQRDGVAGVDPGDEIVVGDGWYIQPNGLNVTTPQLEIHGPLNTAPSLSTGPRILVGGTNGLVIAGNLTMVRGLTVIGNASNTGAAFTLRGDSMRFVQRIMAVSVAGYGCSVEGYNIAFTYGMCRGVGGGLRVVYESEAYVRREIWLQQLDLLAQSPSRNGLEVRSAGLVTVRVNVTNSVIRGGDSGTDILATTDGFARAEVIARSSNFRTRDVQTMRASITAPSDNLNRSDDPGLTWQPDGSWRPSADSSVVNRGSSLPVSNTSTDLGGGGTPIGGSRDIGAYEYNGGLPPASPPGFEPPPEVAGQLGGSGAVANPPAVGGNGGNGGLVEASITTKRPRLRVARSSLVMRTRVTVPGAGTVTQRVTVRRGRRTVTVCAARLDVVAAGSRTMVCRLSRAARTALRAKRQRYTVRTTFATASDSAVSVQRLNAKRRR